MWTTLRNTTRITTSTKRKGVRNEHQLLKALQKLEAVYLGSTISLRLRNMVYENELNHNLVSSEWLDWRRSGLAYLPNFKNDSGTYADCYEAEVSLEGEYIQVELVVYEGDNITGARRERRCKFVFHFEPEELPKVIVDCVEREAAKYAREEVEEQLKQEFLAKVNLKFNEIFG